MLKRTMTVTRGVLLLGIGLVLRQFGLVEPVRAQDFCQHPGICFESCYFSSLPIGQCYDVCDCWFMCKCVNGKSDSYCYSQCTS